jgi:hypothetical protein
VLDPRLSFTRSTNATFINSQGLVQFAGQNLSYNTAFSGLSGSNPSLTSSGWAYAFTTGTATFNGDGSVTMTASSQRIGLNRNAGFTGAGRRVILSVDILTSGDTGLTPYQLIRPGTATAEQYYVNGDTYSSGNVVGPCTLSLAYDSATSGTTTPFFGVGANNTATGTVTFANPRFGLWGGVAPLPYLANTSTTAERHDPRFDHDPTTLAPKGLLVEGSATNTCTYSGDMTQSGAGHWSVRTALITTGWTGFTAPDNTASAVKIIPDTTSSRHTLESSSTSIVSGTVYTASVFVKASGYTVASLVVAGGQTRRNFTLSGAGTVQSQFGVTNTATITPVGTDGWYRITMTWTANATGGAGLWIGVPQNATTDVVSAWSGNGTSAIIAWGAQLETGSGASSYIPTGASQGTRNQDVCYMDTAQVNSWFIKNNEATFQVRYSCDNALSAGTNVFYLGQWGAEYSYGYQHYTYAGSGGTLSGNGKLVSATSADYGIYSNQSLPRVFNTALSFSTSASLIANSWNGNTPSQLSATSWPTWTSTTIRLGIGTNATNGTSSSAGFMRIQSLKYWPTRLSNSQLQALTTG